MDLVFPVAECLNVSHSAFKAIILASIDKCIQEIVWPVIIIIFNQVVINKLFRAIVVEDAFLLIIKFTEYIFIVNSSLKF